MSPAYIVGNSRHIGRATQTRLRKLHTFVLTALVALGVFIPLTLFFVMDFNRFALEHLRSRSGKTHWTTYVPQQIYANHSNRHVDILIVGGSSIREYFPGGEQIDDLLTQSCGTALNAFNAATSSQNIADTLAIIDALDSVGALPKVIVVGMTYYRLTPTWADARAILRSQKVALPASRTLLRQLSPLQRLTANFTDKFKQIERLAWLLRRAKWAHQSELGEFENQHSYDRAAFRGKLWLHSFCGRPNLKKTL